MNFSAQVAKSRPSLDDLLHNLQVNYQNQETGGQSIGKAGKAIKFGWINGVLVHTQLLF